MKYTQFFFVEDRLLAQAPREGFFSQGQLWEPSSDLYMCPVCGEVHARLPVSRPDGSTTHWMAWARVCRRCVGKSQWESEPGGSLWRSWDREFLEALPPEILLREFQLHYTHIYKEPL